MEGEERDTPKDLTRALTVETHTQTRRWTTHWWLLRLCFAPCLSQYHFSPVSPAVFDFLCFYEMLWCHWQEDTACTVSPCRALVMKRPTDSSENTPVEVRHRIENMWDGRWNIIHVLGGVNTILASSHSPLLSPLSILFAWVPLLSRMACQAGGRRTPALDYTLAFSPSPLVFSLKKGIASPPPIGLASLHLRQERRGG